MDSDARRLVVDLTDESDDGIFACALLRREFACTLFPFTTAHPPTRLFRAPTEIPRTRFHRLPYFVSLRF